MVPSKVLVVALMVCLGISLFFDSFLYIQTLDLRKEINGFTEQIDNLTGQIDNLTSELNDLTLTKNFTFELPLTLGGFLKIELTFRIVEENLSMTAKLNHTQGGLILVFDRNGDGKITRQDDGWILYSNNKYHPTDVDPLTGSYSIPYMLPYLSPYHHAEESENETIFHISFPLNFLNLHNDLVYVSSQPVLSCGVLFHFGLKVEN